MQFKKLYHIFTQDAFARRVVIYEPTQPFMTNVYITNNTNNYILSQNIFKQHVEEEKQLIKDHLDWQILTSDILTSDITD